MLVGRTPFNVDHVVVAIESFSDTSPATFTIRVAVVTVEVSVEEPAVMKSNVKLFTDRDYTLAEAPEFLLGKTFFRTSIEEWEVECVKPGEVFVMTLSKPHSANRSAELISQNFTKVATPDFQLFPGEINRVQAWRKSLNPGDRLNFK